MVEVGDKVYSYIFPEECSVGIVVAKKSEGVFMIEWINRIAGKLYKKTILDYDIYK